MSFDYDDAPGWMQEKADSGEPFTRFEEWWIELQQWHDDLREDRQEMDGGDSADREPNLGAAIRFWYSFPLSINEWVDEMLRVAGVCLFKDRHLPGCRCEECESLTGRSVDVGHRNGGHCYCEDCWQYMRRGGCPEREDDILVECLLEAAELNRHLFIEHHSATQIIASHCDKEGIDSADIVVSSIYCREFLSLKNRGKFYGLNTNRSYHWPEILPLLELPDDIRVSIMNGVAAVRRLQASRGIRTPQPMSSGEALNDAEANILQALEESGPLKAEGLSLAATGKESDGMFRVLCSAMKRRELITSGIGRNSKGYEITDKGRSLLKQHRVNCQDDSENCPDN
jgi:hypothetical protein